MCGANWSHSFSSEVWGHYFWEYILSIKDKLYSSNVTIKNNLSIILQIINAYEMSIQKILKKTYPQKYKVALLFNMHISMHFQMLFKKHIRMISEGSCDTED